MAALSYISSLLSSLSKLWPVLAACTISHEQYRVKSFSSMPRPLIGQCCTDTGRWLAAEMNHRWCWYLCRWVEVNHISLGTLSEFFSGPAFRAENRNCKWNIELCSSISPGRSQPKENKKSPSVKIFKTVGQTFSQSQFYNPGLGNPPQLSRVSQCHSLLTSQFADLNFVVSICSRLSLCTSVPKT